MRRIIAHGHIFKNAGSTFDWSLHRSLGRRFCEHQDDQRMVHEGAEHVRQFLDDHPKIQALSSHHLCYPLPEGPDLSFIRCYLVRHPIDRAWSVYHFERRQNAPTIGAQKAKELDFEGYVEWRLHQDTPNTIRNHQTAYIAGTLTGKAARQVQEESLDMARRNLETACAGVVDRYDESMVVMEHTFEAHGMPMDLAYRRQNVGTESVDNLHHSIERTLDHLQQTGRDLVTGNYFDLRLYHHANRLLDERIHQIADFDSRLERFRDRCAAL